ncbi:MAG: DUF2007 domain-containing protein [SAR324 cluster bacterium]|nr:DUF2007 domain-containing protein [SAR324 cluster bacterium]
MNTRMLLSFFISWAILAFVYEIPEGRATYGKPIYAALLYFLNYYLLYFLSGSKSQNKDSGASHPKFNSGSKSNLSSSAKSNSKLKSGESSKIKAKIFNINDYKSQRINDEPNEDFVPWIEVYSCLDQAQIGMVQSILVSREISTQTTNTHVASFFPKVEGLEMQILVPKDQEEQALEILKAHNLLPGIGGNDQ